MGFDPQKRAGEGAEEGASAEPVWGLAAVVHGYECDSPERVGVALEDRDGSFASDLQRPADQFVFTPPSGAMKVDWKAVKQ